MLTYRNFGALSYSGADVSFEFLASDQLSILGNASITSDDFFGPAELDEEGSDLYLALNASTFKGRLGFKYASPSGFRVDASARYTEGFPVASGPYVGGLPSPYNTPGNPYDVGVESFFLLDLGFGYDFGSAVQGLTLDLGISNALDNLHREFIGAPQLGRMGIARLTYSM
jgi:iron complex outermembrane receptor protein